jgi:hypothetical protein
MYLLKAGAALFLLGACTAGAACCAFGKESARSSTDPSHFFNLAAIVAAGIGRH